MADHAHLHKPVYGAVAAAVFTIILKFAAYWYTGSVGLFADAAESLVNLFASLTALGSLWYAARPVDADHAFGHEKIVFFSSGLEGVLVAIAGLGTAAYAIERIINPIELRKLEVGTLIALFASLINFGVARWLLHVGRKHKSLVLEADGQHLMTDVWTSVAVVVGLSLAIITGIQLLDPICALLMAAFILRTGYQLMRRSFDGLMDRALPPEEQDRLRKVIDAHISANCAYHALRTRQAGNSTFIDFHFLVPGSLSVRQAHAHGDRIEDALRKICPDAQITIHIEPIEEPASWRDSELIPIEQKE
jgi:cation diffusion facilitator family transporter